jgi:hypothetical protein
MGRCSLTRRVRLERQRSGEVQLGFEDYLLPIGIGGTLSWVPVLAQTSWLIFESSFITHFLWRLKAGRGLEDCLSGEYKLKCPQKGGR